MMMAADPSVTSQIADLALYATAVTLGVSLAFALALVGTVRASEARRDGSAATALPWSILAFLGYAAFAALAIKGIIVVTTK